MPEPSYVEYVRTLDAEGRERYLEEMARADVASMRHEGIDMDYDSHLAELRRTVAEMLGEG